MSALEVIEQIRALPPEERAQVVDFVRQLEPDSSAQVSKCIDYASPDEVKAAGDRVIEQYKNVFRRLAD